MSSKKKKKLTPTQQQYQEYAKQREPKRPVFINCVKAFLVGGLICTLGQGLQSIFVTYFNFDKVTAGNPTSAVLIMLSVLLTGLGVYDHIAQWAGRHCHPVTGFANTMASAAIEHRSEGYVLGVGQYVQAFRPCNNLRGVLCLRGKPRQDYNKRVGWYVDA